MAKNRIPTPLEYIHWKLGFPPPEEEPEVQMMPVPTPVYMPNPQTVDASAMYGNSMAGPALPPPIAPPPPTGMSGNGMGMYAPDGGMFG
jgi:hypothetical protein